MHQVRMDEPLRHQAMAGAEQTLKFVLLPSAFVIARLRRCRREAEVLRSSFFLLPS
jgi:hypothetical protein